jgi:Mrp family chromosome partitioning ATPase
LVDLTLLVISAGHTKKEQLLRAYEQLALANVGQLGIVHNQVSGDSSYGSGYGDRYTSRYAARRDHPDGARDSGRKGVRQLSRETSNPIQF